jgi:adenine deaminase
VKTRVFSTLRDHNFRELVERGLLVNINSDDPAYFGGYIADNYIETAEALDLTVDQMIQVARNSFVASFLSEEERQRHLDAIDAFVSG